MEIPCLACPTLSHFIQNKSKISTYCPGTSLKKVNTILFNNYDQFKCGENSVDPDQLASSEAS